MAIKRIAAKQQGAVLIVALVLLLVLTVLGTAGIRDTTMAERMSGNFRDLSEAMQSAETALRYGEVGVSTTSIGDPADASDPPDLEEMNFDNAIDTLDGAYAISSVSVDPFADNRYVFSIPADAVSPNVRTDPDDDDLSASRYYVERLPDVPQEGGELGEGNIGLNPPPLEFYRITAKGFGISPNSEVILQSTYFPVPADAR